MRKPVVVGFYLNNKGADQLVHLHSLISIYAVPFLACMIASFHTSKISRFQLASVAEQFDLCLFC